MKVLVLGCGPTGLIAAHAAAMLDHDVVIVSKGNRKSHLFGCQYLHQKIPGIDCGPGIAVDYRLSGTVENYRLKVYGQNYRGTVSPDQYEGEHVAYDIRSAYEQLWDMYGPYVIDQDLSHGIPKWAEEADVVFNTIPAKTLCRNEAHVFTSQYVWAIGDAPEVGQRCPVVVPEFSVVCNGMRSPSWYRASNVFGYTTAEWAGETKPPISGVAAVEKPIETNCDCHPHVIRLGRYGKWQKGVLSHEAFAEVQQELGQLRLF